MEECLCPYCTSSVKTPEKRLKRQLKNILETKKPESVDLTKCGTICTTQIINIRQY